MTASSAQTARTSGARTGVGARAVSTRASPQHVVGAGRQRRARRAAQHEALAPALQHERHVGVAFADRLDVHRRPRPGRARRGRPRADRARGGGPARWRRPPRVSGRRRRARASAAWRAATLAGPQPSAFYRGWGLVCRRSFLLCLAVLAAACLALPAAAAASARQTMSFEAPRDLRDPATRDAALDEIAGLGVHALRVILYWQDVAPAAAVAGQAGVRRDRPRAPTTGAPTSQRSTARGRAACGSS